jgi:hypothetical protein
MSPSIHNTNIIRDGQYEVGTDYKGITIEKLPRLISRFIHGPPSKSACGPVGSTSDFPNTMTAKVEGVSWFSAFNGNNNY